MEITALWLLASRETYCFEPKIHMVKVVDRSNEKAATVMFERARTTAL
jgi:hypothetical protein